MEKNNEFNKKCQPPAHLIKQNTHQTGSPNVVSFSSKKKSESRDQALKETLRRAERIQWD